MRGKNNWQRTGDALLQFKNFIKKGGANPWYWNYRFKWNHYPKLNKVGEFPTEIIIETTGNCNLKCTMCFRSYLPTTTRAMFAQMDLDTYKKIIDECKENNIAAVKLSWRGEVLLNRNFVEMVKYAKDAGIKEVSTLSNATLLTPEVSKGLIKAGIDQIVFSVDGITKETYEKIRIGGNYEKVIENIENFIKIKGNRKKPFTRIQLTALPENKAEVKKFVSYWKKKFDEVAISGFIDYSYIGKDYEDKIQEELKNAKGRLACKSLWRRLAIMADGTATVCCIDVEGNLAIGNVKETSIKSLWNGPKLNAYRKIHLAKKLDSIEACKNCNARETYAF